MPFPAEVFLPLATAVTELALTRWIGPTQLTAAAAQSATEFLAGKLSNNLEQRKQRRENEQIEEILASQLADLTRHTNTTLSQQDVEVVIAAAAATITQTTPSLANIIQGDLQPRSLQNHFLDQPGRSGGNPGLAADADSEAGKLYRHLLLHAARQIIDSTSKLPTFRLEVFQELLTRTSGLSTLINDGLAQLRNIFVTKIAGDDDAFFEKQYRATFKSQHSAIKLVGIDVNSTSKSYDLLPAYTQLTLIPTTDSSTAGDSITTSLTFAEAVQQHPRLVVRGPAGYGKTTSAVWCALKTATMTHQGDCEFLNQFIPFAIFLRNFTDKPLPNPDSFAAHSTPHIAGEPEGWSIRSLRERQTVLFIDGIDEFPEGRLEEVQNWLTTILTQFPDSRCIVTTRPNAIPDDWLKELHFFDALLEKMQSRSIATFVKNWHRAVAENLATDSEKSELQQAESGFLARIESDDAKIAELATTPLLCAILCALNKERNGNLPESRSKIYDACIDMYFRRDLERRIHVHTQRPSDTKLKQILGKLSWWMLQNHLSVATPDQVEYQITNAISGDSDLANTFEATSVRKFLEERLSILQRIDKDVFFPHRSFQECFAADFAIQADYTRAVVLNSADHRYLDLVLIVAERINNISGTQVFLDALLEIAESDSATARQKTLPIVARRRLQWPPSQASEDRVANLLTASIPPKTMRAALELADAGDLVANLLKYERTMSANDLRFCVRCLSRIGTITSGNVLLAYTRDSRRTVLREVLFASSDLPLSIRGALQSGAIESLIRESEKSHPTVRMKVTEFVSELAGPGPWHEICDLSWLRLFPHLVVLDVSGTQIRNLNGIESLQQLSDLIMNDCRDDIDLSATKGRTLILKK